MINQRRLTRVKEKEDKRIARLQNSDCSEESYGLHDEQQPGMDQIHYANSVNQRRANTAYNSFGTNYSKGHAKGSVMGSRISMQ